MYRSLLAILLAASMSSPGRTQDVLEPAAESQIERPESGDANPLVADDGVGNADDEMDDVATSEACLAPDDSLFKPIGQIRAVLVADDDRLPPDCSGQFFTSELPGSQKRFVGEMNYRWQPTNFFHMPAYFDDVPLERYGQSVCPFFQPVISGTKFVLQVPMLPYKMGVDPPHACITSLGHQPPGNCVPCIRQTLPFETDASMIQAVATVGLVFLLP